MCICDNCKNLKTKAGENEGELIASCEFGFLSDDCDNCDLDGCDLNCENFVELPEVESVTFSCVSCGKNIVGFSDATGDDVYCIDCFLKKF